MKDTEFCYWLKGAIDMNQSDSFGINATQTIKSNLDAVFAANANPNAFCHFLQGYLTLTNPEILSKEIVDAIVPRLNNFAKPTPVSDGLNEVERFNRQAIAEGRSERAKC
jgi:hypothetical protein